MSATGFLDACGFFPAAGGTADFVVSSAVTGYQTPASAGATNGAVYSYRAQSSDLSQWEIGYGAYTTSTTTLARTTITASSTGSKVNFSAPPSVYVTALSADLKNAALLDNGQFGFHNRLINPSGMIWQRVNSGAAAITDGTYAFDRWYGLTQSAGVTASQVANAENGTPYMMRLSQANATAQRFGIAQAVETVNIIDLRGQDVTLSARVRMSASTTLRYAILEWTGTADAITRDVVNNWTSTTYTPGNFFIASNVAVVATGSVALTANTLASVELTGTASGSMNNVYVVFWTDSTQAQNVTLDIGNVQLERGAKATPLAMRAMQQETLLCQRYYEKTYPSGDPPGTAYVSAGGGGAFKAFAFASNNWMNLPTWYFSVRKRVSPTLSVYSPLTGTSGVVRDANGGADRSAGIDGGPATANASLNNVAVGAVNFIYGHMVAEAEL